MTLTAVIVLAGVFAVIFTASVPLGLYMCSVFDGSLSGRFRWMRWTENVFLAPLGSSSSEPMNWAEYCRSLIAFTFVGAVAAYAVFRLQHLLPWNPLQYGPLKPDLAFNVAVSFATSTTWQSYAGEQVMSLFSQAAGLTVLTFFSSAVGTVAVSTTAKSVAATVRSAPVAPRR